MDKHVQRKIALKLKQLRERDEIGAFIKPLTNFGDATHRLRIGDYRLLLEKESETEFLILDIGDRKDVYR